MPHNPEADALAWVANAMRSLALTPAGRAPAILDQVATGPGPDGAGDDLTAGSAEPEATTADALAA